MVPPVDRSAYPVSLADLDPEVHAPVNAPAAPQIPPLTPVERSEFARELEVIFRDAERGLPVESKIEQLLLKLIVLISEQAERGKKLVELEERSAKFIEKRRMDLAEKEAEEAQSVKVYAKAEKAVSTVGLAATALSALFMEVTPLNLIGLGLSVLNTIDELLDDAGKKAIVGWIAPQDKESQKAYLQRLQFFCAIGSFGLSFAIRPDTAVNVAMQVSKGAVALAKTNAENRSNDLRANLVDLNNQIDFTDAQRDFLMQALIQHMQEIHQYYLELKQNLDAKAQLAHLMNRR